MKPNESFWGVSSAQQHICMPNGRHRWHLPVSETGKGAQLLLGANQDALLNLCEAGGDACAW